jgi:hypothetical protein
MTNIGFPGDKDGFIWVLASSKAEVVKKIKMFSNKVERSNRESLKRSNGVSNIRLGKVSNVPVGR